VTWLPRFISSAGGRKFIFLVTVLALASAALYVDKLDGSQWVDLLKWLGTGFLLSAAAEGVAQRINGKAKPPEPKSLADHRTLG
jgi:hypothetical protein